MKTFTKMVAAVFGGLCVSLVGYFVSMIGLGVTEPDQRLAMAVLCGFFVIGALLALTAPTTGKAWRRTMLTSGVLSLCLPLATLAFSSRLAGEIGQGDAATAAGAAIGGAVVFGASGIVGFFLAAVFLVIGFMSGREARVVYVRQAPGDAQIGQAGSRDYDRFG